MLYQVHATLLIHLQDEDLRVRQQLAELGLLTDGYNPQMEAVHLANADQLKTIIAEIGWPTRVKVGEEASQAAWLIVQHSISLPAFMRFCLRLIEQEIPLGTVDPVNHAFLYDRIAMYEGRPQRFGTQFISDEMGNLVSYQLDASMDVVNERRQALGLNSVQERLSELSEGLAAKPPADFQEQQKTYDAWRRNVGWI
ncbi:hypothetical protein GCM10027341_15990 [Spirosoma knui]